MNWKELNEKYPQAFLEFANSEEKGPIKTLTYDNPEMYQSKTDACFKTDDGGYKWFFGWKIWQLPEYFDALGIHVDAYQIDEAARVLREFAGLETKHSYSVTVKSPTVWEGETYPARREALEAGVIKAFEIREEQLKFIYEL